MAEGNPKPSVHADLAKLEGQIIFNKWVAWILVGLGGIAAGWGLWIFRNDLSSKTDLSSIGSYFQGAVGSLWALAGLMFIYVAFLGQKQQLLLQREAMELQKKQFDQEQSDKAVAVLEQSNELDRQKEQFRLQQESIKRQNFESAFFQLLNLHNQNVSQLRYEDDKQVHEGRRCFIISYNYAFLKGFASWKSYYPTEDITSIKCATDYYLYFYKNHRGMLPHYFRTLYHIFKFLKHGDIPDSEEKRYASLARAQLSSNELAFLFYNGISPYGEKFKPLIEEFGLLEHLDIDKLLHPSHKNFYDPKAFK